MWESIALEVLRVMINDIDGTTYADCRLEKIVHIAAMHVLKDVSFTTEYTLTLSTWSISPDPSTDNNFILLTALKAACIIAQGEVKTESAGAIKVVDGPSSIDLSGKLDGLKSNLTTSCDAYTNAVQEYVRSNVIGEAILGPYSPGFSFLNGYTNAYPQ